MSGTVVQSKARSRPWLRAPCVSTEGMPGVLMTGRTPASDGRTDVRGRGGQCAGHAPASLRLLRAGPPRSELRCGATRGVHMRRYETMVIIPDTMDEDAASSVFDRFKGVLTDQGGELLDQAWWGRRRLAYEINKRDHAFYGVLDYRATAEAVTEVERQMKISDDIVRFKTVRPEVRVRSRA